MERRWPTAAAAAAAGLVIFAAVCTSGRGSLQRLELQGDQGFPGIRSPDRHGWAPSSAPAGEDSLKEGGEEGNDENGEMTPEHQAEMHVEWERIMGSTNAKLKKQIANGQEADRRLRDTMGPVHWAHYFLPRSPPPSSPCSLPANSASTSDSTPSSPCGGAGHLPAPNDQIFATPEVIPGPPVLVDPEEASEQRRLREEDEMAKELERQGEKLEMLRRKMAERRHVLEEKPEKKGLWDGVHLTSRDLEPKSKSQKRWEAHLWRKWDRENKRFPRSDLGDMLRAARNVAAARAKGRGASDRAEQAEIGEVDGGKRAMYWERDADLHYRDLGPDGRPVESEGGEGAAAGQEEALIGSGGISGTTSSVAAAVGGESRGVAGGMAKAGRGGYANPMCQFCGGGKGGAEKDRVAEHGGEVHGQKVFTRSDWDAVKKGKDFVTTFPDTDDLRTLDWLGGEKEKPYTAEEDSMSAAGVHAPLPGDWEDFPKAKGTYTHFGIGPHIPPRWS